MGGGGGGGGGGWGGSDKARQPQPIVKYYHLLQTFLSKQNSYFTKTKTNFIVFKDIYDSYCGLDTMAWSVIALAV